MLFVALFYRTDHILLVKTEYEYLIQVYTKGFSFAMLGRSPIIRDFYSVCNISLILRFALIILALIFFALIFFALVSQIGKA